jgi:signal transduction histidine kinase
VFLPLTPQTQTPTPAVVVFASRSRGSYDGAQMRFLGNIAQLITQSFARTVRLTEHARLAAIGEFASTIAHELRTPLTTVGLALEHLNRQELPEKAARRLQLAAGESARMRRLLEEILLYAKPLRLDLRVLDLAAFVARHVEESGSTAAARGQQLRLAPGPGRICIQGDEDRLRQILSNLTQNACEAAPEGAVVTWSLREDPSAGSAAAEIHNPGAAIPPELLGRVMEPFFSTKQGGTGLGLAIVKRLVELQGGEVTVRSAAPEGTRVRVELPRAPRNGP